MGECFAPGSHERSPSVSALRVSIPFADLSEGHARHIARVAEIDAQFDAWSARLDACIKQLEVIRG